MRTKILGELAKLKPGTTVCAGRLSRNVGRTLRELRPTLDQLARAGDLAYYQRGQRVTPGDFRGPFRVARE